MSQCEWEPDEIGVLLQERRRLTVLLKLSKTWLGKGVYDAETLTHQLTTIEQTIANYLQCRKADIEISLRERNQFHDPEGFADG